ncbi:MAG: hypothetical protein OXC95_01500 [Dehalococcoidia bacterium]|nr:hypothetical protein [Dehalococcoidia bacterium]
MTNQNNDPPIARRHSEHRILPPFGDGTHPYRVANLLSNTLASCEFMPFPDGKFSEESTYYLGTSDNERDIEPSFKFVLNNSDEMTKSIGADKNDLSLIVSARNNYLKRYKPIAEWNLVEVPSGPWSPKPAKLHGLQSRRAMSFIVAIRVSNSTPILRDNGLDIGKVLCRREFHVREPSDFGASFPFEWSKFGPPTDYPDELLWAIEWFDADGDDNPYKRPVKDVLLVRGNAKVEKILLEMNRVQGAHGLVWKSIASEIITDIWTTVITNCKDDPPVEGSDDDTIAGQVFRRISTEANMPYEEVPTLAADAPEYTELRKVVAKAIKVVV